MKITRRNLAWHLYLAGLFCIRINEQYRVCFEWSDFGPEAVEVVDYH